MASKSAAAVHASPLDLDEPVCLYADAARLEQVVVHLLTNAAKYTDEGGHIPISLQQEADRAVLRVQDTGIGITPELLPRIFDLFSQAERSLDRSQGGLGIGLCLVQRLVELHGGTVEAHSSVGKGSEFVVRLPVLLDIGLPGLTGFEVARQIRQLSTLEHIELIAMTGYGQDTDRQLSQQAGLDHHLVKPADFNQVLEILATVSAKLC